MYSTASWRCHLFSKLAALIVVVIQVINLNSHARCLLDSQEEVPEHPRITRIPSYTYWENLHTGIQLGHGLFITVSAAWLCLKWGVGRLLISLIFDKYIVLKSQTSVFDHLSRCFSSLSDKPTAIRCPQSRCIKIPAQWIYYPHVLIEIFYPFYSCLTQPP